MLVLVTTCEYSRMFIKKLRILKLTMVKVNCKYCKYVWNTRSKMKKVACPCCGNKNPNPDWKEK